MVTVFRQSGLAFRVYPNDHLPKHVHVFQAGGEARIEILGQDGNAHVITNHGLSRKDVTRAVELVQQNQVRLLQQWSEYHDH
jgi:Domain of unknown function (DUF4160)